MTRENARDAVSLEVRSRTVSHRGPASFRWLVRNLGWLRAVCRWYFPTWTTVTLTAEDLAALPCGSTAGSHGRRALPAASLDGPVPFLLVKPFGLAVVGRIREVVGSHLITAEVPVEDYSVLAEGLFPRADARERLVWTALMRKLLPPDEADSAVILILRDISYEELDLLKYRVRKAVGVRFFRALLPDGEVLTSVTPVHAPNPHEVAEEWEVCRRHLAGG